MKTVPGLHDSKSTLRVDIRQRRANLDDADRRQLDAAINRHLLEFASQTQPAVVAAYMAFDGEPDLAPALRTLCDRGVSLALPVVQTVAGRAAIGFRQWPADCAMRPNRFGILEPAGTAEVSPGDVDLALIPLVAWDVNGRRLGMGAGFYDRLLQPFAEHPRPLRMGVGYRLQQVERVPLEPWDVTLHRVLTDDGCIACTEAAKSRSARP